MAGRGHLPYDDRYFDYDQNEHEDRYDLNLTDVVDDDENDHSHRDNNDEQENPWVETQGDHCEHRHAGCRDHGERRQRRTLGRRFFANMMEGIRDSIRDLTIAFRQAVRPVGPRGDDPAGTDVMVAMREFQRLHPPSFSGGVDPLAVDDWLKKINRHLNVLGISDGAQRVSLATFQFTEGAIIWLIFDWS